MAEVESVLLKGWRGGLNKEADPLQIELDELAEALNVNVGLSGAVSKRDGYSRFDDSSMTSKAEHLFTWELMGGAKHLVAVDADGDIWTATATTFTEDNTGWLAASDTREWPVAFASLDNVLYLSSTRGSTRSFDGTSWTNISDNTLNGSGTEFPHARHLVSLHERMFAFNVDTNAGTFRSRMYFSEAGEAETWEATNWIDFQPDDGQEITAASAFGENIIVFKNHAVHLLSGTDENSFTRYPLDSKIGTESPGTVVPDGNVIRFFDYQSGVWEFDGASFNKIDDKINTYLLQGVNVGEHHKAVGFVHRSKFYLSVPWGTDTFNSRTFVYDTRTKAWSEWDFGFLGAAEKDRTPHIVSPRDAVGVYQLNDGQTDDGTAVSAEIKTGWLSPKTLAVKHRLRRLDVAFSALGNFDITVEMYRDFISDAYKTKTVNTNPGGWIWGTATWGEDLWGGGLEQVYTRDTGWGKRWRTMAIRFAESTATGDFQINRVTAHISSIGSVRGGSDN